MFMAPLHLVSAFMMSSNISLLRVLSILSKPKDSPIGNLIQIKVGGVLVCNFLFWTKLGTFSCVFWIIRRHQNDQQTHVPHVVKLRYGIQQHCRHSSDLHTCCPLPHSRKPPGWARLLIRRKVLQKVSLHVHSHARMQVYHTPQVSDPIFDQMRQLKRKA